MDNSYSVSQYVLHNRSTFFQKIWSHTVQKTWCFYPSWRIFNHICKNGKKLINTIANLVRIIIKNWLQVFHTHVSCLSFIGVWVTASLIKSTGFRPDLNCAVLKIISTHPLIFYFSRLLIKLFVIFLYAPITNDTTLVFMFPRFFYSSLVRSRHLSLFLFSLIFTLPSGETTKSTIL